MEHVILDVILKLCLCLETWRSPVFKNKFKTSVIWMPFKDQLSQLDNFINASHFDKRMEW